MMVVKITIDKMKNDGGQNYCSKMTKDEMSVDKMTAVRMTMSKMALAK
jgi:hypothetical protein